jgi:hypothetical protein
MKPPLTPSGFTLIGLLSAVAATGANEKLTVRVTPNISSAPSTVTVRAYVEPHQANRRLRVEADSGSFYRSSEVQLEGDEAPTLTEFRFKSLPGGNYIVSATLIDATGQTTVARDNVTVLPRFGEP